MRHAAILLTLLPPALLAEVVWLYGVDVPLWDQWALVPRIEHVFTTGLQADDVLRPHHEHWMPVPLLVTFGLAKLTRWCIPVELWVVYLVGVGVFAVYAARARGRAQLPVLSVLAFSITQHNNWLWGLQLSSMSSLLAALTALHLLCAGRPSNGRLALAALCGLVASGSQFQGNLVWPVGLACVLARGGDERWPVAARAAWAVIGAAALTNAALWLETQEDTRALLADPLRLVAFVAAYLGAPLGAHDDGAALACGGAGALLAGYLLRSAGGPRQATFATGLLLLSLGAATITAVGRLGYGLETARSSRYISYAVPFWVAITLLAQRGVASARLRALLLVAVGGLAAASSLQAVPVARQQGSDRIAAYEHVLERRDAIPDDPAVFAPLFADPELLALLQTAQGADWPAFVDRNREQLDAILARHGLDFVDRKHLRILHIDEQNARVGLVVLKRLQLSALRPR